MNYRVTIEAIAEEAKKEMPEPRTICLNCLILAGNYDAAELPNQGPERDRIEPDTMGQVNVVLGRCGDCVEALHQFMLNMPEKLQSGLVVRAIAERMGVKKTNVVASMQVEPERGWGINGSKI